MRIPRIAAFTIFAASFAVAQTPFYLHEGDRVVFYGDSITDQRLYTTFTESFVVTRFPTLNVAFTHSGWGGDRVTGGGGGPIDLRLARDVFPYRPTVMTIMLGMNDANYKPFDTAAFNTYTAGMEHILDSVRKTLPDCRITLIQPSPYDDVTRPPLFEGGYNAVLLRYSDYLANLAKTRRMDLADLNTPVVAMLRQAMAADPEQAPKINIHFARWRTIETGLATDGSPATKFDAEAALDKLDNEIVAEQRAAAQPRAHRYELNPVQ